MYSTHSTVQISTTILSVNIAASKAKLNYAKRKIFNLGIYGNVKYDYKGIIGADVAYRTDFSPTFGTWKMYPSVSAFWDIQKTFFDSSDVVSSLKFDIGYGESGRDEILNYDCREHLEQLRIKTEEDNERKYNVISDRTANNTDKANNKVGLYAKRDGKTDEYRSKADNYRTAAHIDIRRALILRKQSARESYKAV